jgi:hypothetical protein
MFAGRRLLRVDDEILRRVSPRLIGALCTLMLTGAGIAMAIAGRWGDATFFLANAAWVLWLSVRPSRKR